MLDVWNIWWTIEYALESEGKDCAERSADQWYRYSLTKGFSLVACKFGIYGEVRLSELLKVE